MRRPQQATAECLGQGQGCVYKCSQLLTPLPTLSSLQGLVFLSSSSNADEAQEAEAIQILTSILSIRESTSGKAPQKTVLVLKTLSMLYYLMLKCSKVSFPEKLSKWGGSRAEHLAVQVNYVLPATPGQAFTL